MKSKKYLRVKTKNGKNKQTRKRKTRKLIKKTKGGAPFTSDNPFRPKDKNALVVAINEFKKNRQNAVATYGKMKTWKTELITNMEQLFMDFHFSNDDDISGWDVTGVTSMSEMFKNNEYFNQPLNNWNVSNVLYMYSMFDGCRNFNQPLNDWGDKVSKVRTMERLFGRCYNFNQPLDSWNVSNVNDMENLFFGCRNFNQPLNGWNVSKVRTMNGMFALCWNFNQPLHSWDVSNVENMENLFFDCRNFNQPLNEWGDKVSNVKFMQKMFKNNESFNQPLNNWNVSNVLYMYSMFFGCRNFNQPLNEWGDKVSNVKNTLGMFALCINFNQPLHSWNVSNVENMKGMFARCSNFNQPLNDWGDKLSKVKTMERLFFGCKTFNQPLNGWNLNEDTNIQEMFEGCLAINPNYKPIKYPNILIRYDNVNSEDIKTTDTILPVGITALDVIAYEDINVLDHLNGDKNKNNLVFYYNNACYITDRDILKKLCNDIHTVFYKCHKVEDVFFVSPNMYDYATPYLNGRALGIPCGLIKISQLKTIINNVSEEYQCFEIVQDGIAPSTVALHILLPDYDVTSASHCQAGQDANINNIFRMNWK